MITKFTKYDLLNNPNSLLGLVICAVNYSHHLCEDSKFNRPMFLWNRDSSGIIIDIEKFDKESFSIKVITNVRAGWMSLNSSFPDHISHLNKMLFHRHP